MKVLLENEYPNNVPVDVVVSVRLTTYNHALYIEQAIDSILMQRTSFPFEICIGEDDSTDGTKEICISYAKKYPNTIRLFLRSEKDKIYINGKKTGKYNGIKTREACNGKYIAVLEGDDFWIDREKLQMQYNFMEANPKYNMCAARCLYWSNESGSVVFPLIRGNKEIASFKDLITLKIHPHTSTYFYRKSAVQMLPDWTSRVIQGDLALVLSMGKQNGLPVLRNVTSVYRFHQGGIMKGEEIKKRMEIMKSFWRTYQEFAVENKLKQDVLYATKHLKYLDCFNGYRKSNALAYKLSMHVRAWFIFKERLFISVRLWLISRLL